MTAQHARLVELEVSSTAEAVQSTAKNAARQVAAETLKASDLLLVSL